jgi:hypothetical protein
MEVVGEGVEEEEEGEEGEEGGEEDKGMSPDVLCKYLS